MSGAAIGWCFDEVVIGDPAAKAVLAAIADNADDSGVAWPRQELIAIKTELSVSTVKRRLQKLERLGIIKVVRKWVGKNKTRNLYHLQLDYSFDIPQNIIRRRNRAEGVRGRLSKMDASESPVLSDLQSDGNSEGVSLTPSPEKASEGVPETPLKGSAGPVQISKGSPVTPLKGSPVTYEPPVNHQLTPTPPPSVMPIPISREYRPDPETVDLLRDRGVTEEFIDEYLPQFVKYWADTGKRKDSWHAVFLRQCAEQHDYITGQRR